MVDIALDPFPYGGATTTCEALAMGVPVITLLGTSMVENLSASILQYGGYKDLITTTVDEYIKLAIKMSKEGKRDKEKRQKTRDNFLESDAGNIKRISSVLETTYHDILNNSEKAASK